MKKLWIALFVLLISCMATYQVIAEGLFKVGEKAPVFTSTASTGETVGLDTYKGKVTVLGLFHICDPCMVQGIGFPKSS